MRAILVCALFVLSWASASGDDSESVTRQNAIEAFREFRVAAKLISAIHAELMQASFPGEATEELEIPKERLADYKQARKRLERSAALNPFFPEVYVLLANSYWEIENDLEKTVDCYGKALKLDPDYDDVLSARGQVYLLMERVEEAERDLRRLEALKSEHAPSLREQIAELKGRGEPADGEPSGNRSQPK